MFEEYAENARRSDLALYEAEDNRDKAYQEYEDAVFKSLGIEVGQEIVMYPDEVRCSWGNNVVTWRILAMGLSHDLSKPSVIVQNVTDKYTIPFRVSYDIFMDNVTNRRKEQ